MNPVIVRYDISPKPTSQITTVFNRLDPAHIEDYVFELDREVGRL